MREEGEWEVQGLDEDWNLRVVAIVPELCIPREPLVQAPLASGLLEGLSITAAFSAGPNPCTEDPVFCSLTEV